MWKYNKTENLPGDSLYHSADELYHYGIPGMKWKNHIYAVRQAKYMNKAKKYRSEANGWARAAKQLDNTEGRKKFLGNPSSYDIANNSKKHYASKAKKYERKAAKYMSKLVENKSKQTERGKKAYEKYMNKAKKYRSEANGWARAAKQLDNTEGRKKFLGNPSSYDIANNSKKHYASKAKKYERKAAKYKR